MALIVWLASINVLAQDGGVSLKPILKPGQEARYSLSGSVETQITPAGANGIGGAERRELSATVLLRAGVPATLLTDSQTLQKLGSPVTGNTVAGMGLPYSSERYIYQSNTQSKDVVYYEAVIEALDARATVNGLESPLNVKGVVGQKIGFTLDAAGYIVRCVAPTEAARAGLIDLLFSMLSWSPAQPSAVGQTWGTPAGSDQPGYGYVSAAAMSSVPKSAQTAYTFKALDGGRAVVEGAITLRQPGASMLEMPAARVKVNLIASGGGTTRVEYDVTSNRIASAASESTLKGRVVNIPPTREGEKMQPREGALVETAKFSIR
ncbi:MAG TPA: hypothetical protein VJZ91_01310, partial [Blastocatellia bacterium]|nr:hypothetical protein [Blastocatellia bacterium]